MLYNPLIESLWIDMIDYVNTTVTSVEADAILLPVDRFGRVLNFEARKSLESEYPTVIDILHQNSVRKLGLQKQGDTVGIQVSNSTLTPVVYGVAVWGSDNGPSTLAQLTWGCGTALSHAKQVLGVRSVAVPLIGDECNVSWGDVAEILSFFTMFYGMSLTVSLQE